MFISLINFALKQNDTMKELYAQSETRICKAIFPDTLNANNTLFGGKAMQWMDEAAYISATRFTRLRMFTSSTSNIRFKKAVEPNSIIEVIARVINAGPVKLLVKVEIIAEEMYGNQHFTAIEGEFTLVSLNANNKPQRIDYSNVLALESI